MRSELGQLSAQGNERRRQQQELLKPRKSCTHHDMGIGGSHLLIGPAEAVKLEDILYALARVRLAPHTGRAATLQHAGHAYQGKWASTMHTLIADAGNPLLRHEEQPGLPSNPEGVHATLPDPLGCRCWEPGPTALRFPQVHVGCGMQACFKR